MNQPIFGDTAVVKLQSEQALDLIEAETHYAQYQLNGFEELQVFLTDHREEGALALQEWSNSGDVDRFLSRFNTPAFVLVNQAGERTWTIDLYDTSEISPINTLTIGVSIPEPLPIHSYDFYHFEPDGQNHYHILSIYQNDPELIPTFSLVPAYAEL
ncbi:MAG: hypothetical protein IH586_11640 [Anaerolineaceae bacterium]|nr:hypothetical protein [Anaerolineaceae bacterium]